MIHRYKQKITKPLKTLIGESGCEQQTTNSKVQYELKNCSHHEKARKGHQ